MEPPGRGGTHPSPDELVLHGQPVLHRLVGLWGGGKADPCLPPPPSVVCCFHLGERGTSRPGRVGRGRGQQKGKGLSRSEKHPATCQGCPSTSGCVKRSGDLCIRFNSRSKSRPHPKIVEESRSDLRAAFHRTGRGVPRIATGPRPPGHLVDVGPGAAECLFREDWGRAPRVDHPGGVGRWKGWAAGTYLLPIAPDRTFGKSILGGGVPWLKEDYGQAPS